MRSKEPYILVLENAKIPKPIKDTTIDQKELWEKTHPQFNFGKKEDKDTEPYEGGNYVY